MNLWPYTTHTILISIQRYRPHSSSKVYQQDGRWTFKRYLPVNTWDVELVHRASYNHLSGTSTRFAESSTYCSWRSHPGTTAVNALCQPWGTSIGYALPPFCMIGRCLAKDHLGKVLQIILITPPWKSQS